MGLRGLGHGVDERRRDFRDQRGRFGSVENAPRPQCAAERRQRIGERGRPLGRAVLNRIFDSPSSGLSKFVLSWAMPSALTVGVFAVFIFPEVRAEPLFAPIRDAASSPVSAAAVLGFTIAALSVVFACTSLPIYRFLEGYRLPRPMAKRLLRRQRRRWAELDRYARYPRPAAASSKRCLGIDHRLEYPEHWRHVRPTRAALRPRGDGGRPATVPPPP